MAVNTPRARASPYFHLFMQNLHNALCHLACSPMILLNAHPPRLASHALGIPTLKFA